MQADRRGLGRRRAVPGRLASRPTAAGPSGTASTATRCASSSRATWARSRELALRLQGSPDLYYGRGTAASVNFITCHDGFTLADMVSYNDKHNEANGEDNNDGANDNNSWNCGWEGADRRSGDQRPSQPADEERRRHAAGQPGRADDPHGRRGRPHPARQQQHLLPRQRAQLVRLVAGGRERRAAAVLPHDDPPSATPTPCCGAAIICGHADYAGAGLPDISWHGTRSLAARLVGHQPRSGVHAVTGKHAKGGRLSTTTYMSR